MNEITINTANYTLLSIFAIKSGQEDGIISINNVEYFSFRAPKGDHITIQVSPEMKYGITLTGLRLSLMYLHGNPDSPEAMIIYPKKEIIQQRYHFSPPAGWMNDPNGLCFHDGWYHMFYQFNPFDNIWGDCHWGHARSKDLLHWEHLPVALYPQDELKYLPSCRGGAYSGTATIIDGDINLFFTRHIGDNNRTWCLELPWRAKSKDSILFEIEGKLINLLPPELASDFRDPKIIKDKEVWIMLTGTHIKSTEQPAISVHISKNLTEWEYKGLLYIEQTPKYKQAECPDLLKDGDKWLLIAGYHNRETATDQIRRDTVVYRGYIEGYKFIEEERTTMDDGKDFYAPQSIAGIEQNIVIGWINDMAHQFIKHPDKVNGMMSLPRLLTWNESGFTSYPIDSAANLFGPELPHSNEYKTNGSYLLRLTKTAKTVLAASEKGLITAEITEDGYGKIEIFGEVFKYGSERHKIHEISVFFDVEVFEIFINHGENAITRRFQVNYPEYDIRLISGNPSAVSLRPYKPS